MDNPPKKEHIYPHQSEVHYGPLAPEDLARDIAEHPDAYDRTLVEHHIKPFIAQHGLQFVDYDDEAYRVSSSRTPREIEDILSSSNENVRLTRYDALALIEAGKVYEVVCNLDKFTDLDSSVAHALIEAKHGGAVIYNLDKFTGLDHNEIAHALIKAGYGNDVAYNLDKFTGLDHNEIAHALIDGGDGYLVAYNLDKFTGLDHNEIAHTLIEAEHGGAVADNLDKFTGLDHNEIAHALIETGQGDSVADNLDKFTGLDNAVAQALIGEGYLLHVLQASRSFEISMGEVLIANLNIVQESEDIADAVIEHFSAYNLDSADAMTVLTACATLYSTAQKIKQLDLDSIVGVENAEVLRDTIALLKPLLKGVRNHNPYEDSSGDMDHVTSSRPGTDFHAEARKVSERLRKPETEHDKEIANTIRHAYEELIARVKNDKGETYASRLFGGRGDSGGDAWPTYRRLVADYIAVDGDESLEHALTEAQAAFEQVLRVDTVYYDKLFYEWDSKRIGEQEFQEVFLGRDGVYAYIGRRAQIFARRRRLGHRNNSKSQDFLDFPTYLIYSRGSRDNLGYEAKKAYLNQSIPNPESAHYYDTGFTGTIPIDIMRVLGISEEDMDRRIRLLSATQRGRTVLGVRGSEDERSKIVNTIEHNVKDEESSEGLYEHPDGRLESYAQPTLPGERLAFRMTQLALHRHYYAKELADTAPVNLGYKKYNLESGRSFVANTENQEATEAIRTLFSSEDIGKHLLENTASLKIADPSDPYPDEAVFESKLPGIGDVIIKTVVRAKQQGPIDEFEALILLKRLGIDVPAPIARVFTGENSGFIVMDKLQGESGRIINNYFEKHQVNAQNQSDILQDAMSRMQTIAETVRRDTGLDKPWRLKDFMIEYEVDEKGIHHIKTMKPIDFERAKVFDPNSPHSVKLGQGLDVLIGA